MSAITVFPTTLWRHRVPAAKYRRWNSDLYQEAKVYQKIDRAGKTWSRENYFGGYTSYSSVADLPFRSSVAAQVKEAIDREVLKYARHLDFDLNEGELVMTTCWLNVMGRGCYHGFHLHPMSAISGTYYVRVPKGSGKIKFEDPRVGDFMGSPPRRLKARQDNQRYVALEPKEGEIVLFESWQKHEVTVNESREERVSMSFNYEWSPRIRGSR